MYLDMCGCVSACVNVYVCVCVCMHVYICRATTGKGCPEACQKDYKSLADFGSNFTLFLDASLIIFSPHAR